MSGPSKNWEDVYAVQTARIADLERENAALKREAALDQQNWYAECARLREERDDAYRVNAALQAELAALREEKAELLSDYLKLGQMCEKELNSLRADKARLVEAAQLAVDTIVCGHRHGFEPNSGAYALPRLRAAIDAAKEELNK